MKDGLYKYTELNLWCTTCKEITKHTEYLDKVGGYLEGVVCSKCKTNKQRKYPSYFNCYPYKGKCENCGKEIIFLTQDDDRPEYGTTVGVICECKEIVWITLPVN